MNIRKWKDSPALKETRDMLEIKLEDKKVRGILNWIFQIAVVLIFGILAGIALFHSITCRGCSLTWEKMTRTPFLAHSSYSASSALRAVTSSALTMCIWMTVKED